MNQDWSRLPDIYNEIYPDDFEEILDVKSEKQSKAKKK